MAARRPTVEIIDDEMAAVLRAKSGADKLRIADRLFHSAKQLIMASITASHPEWTADQKRREAARRISGGAS